MDRKSAFLKRLCQYHFFHRSEIDAIWKTDYPNAQDRSLFLSFMEQAKLCFQVSESNSDDPKYVVPRLLPEKRPNIVSNYFDLQSDMLHLKYSHQNLHYGFIQEFIVKMGRKTDLGNIWQNGIFFSHEENLACIEADFDQNTISVKVHGKQVLNIMKAIRSEFRSIYGDAKVSVSASTDGIKYKTTEQLADYQNDDELKTIYEHLYWALESVDNNGMDALKIPDTPNQNVNQLISKNMLNIFISYSKHDIEYLKEIKNSLKRYERKEQAKIWYDGEIEAGAEWNADIKENLQKADLIIFLVSRDFIKTDYIWDVEIKQAMEWHEKGEAVVIPIIIRPCSWTGGATPFDQLNALPTKGKPISSWEDVDDAWVNVEQGLKTVIEKRLK